MDKINIFLVKKTVLFVVLGLLVIFWLVPFIWGKTRLPPRVYLGKVALSGGVDWAGKKIDTEVSRYESSPYILFFQNKKVGITPNEIGIQIDKDRTFKNLLDALSIGSFTPKHTLRWWQCLFWGYKTPIFYSIDLDKFKSTTRNKLGLILSPMVDSKISLKGNQIEVVPSKEGEGIDEMLLAAQVIQEVKEWEHGDIRIRPSVVRPEISTKEALAMKKEIEKLIAYPFVFRAQGQNFNIPPQVLLSLVDFQKQKSQESANVDQREDIKTIANVVLSGQRFGASQNDYQLIWDVNRQAVEGFLKREIEGTIYREKKNGVLAFDGAAIKEIQPSQSELTIDTDNALEIIVKAFRESKYFIDLPVKENPAPISLTKAQEIGVNTLIGRGESNFTGSPKNRRHNIGVGASKFNGAIIPKGEIFSFLKTLGPVDQNTGYLPELVIKKDKTVPEYGGGMCQVSSTCFRAAVNSGLRVVERQNHAYPVQYYSPQGTDATVYIPKPDLKFINDTPGDILIQTRIEGNLLFFDFFGQSGGRKVELEGPRTWDKKPDGSMRAEWIQRVYDQDGKLMFQKNFLSKYESPSKFPHPADEKPPKENKKKKKKN